MTMTDLNTRISDLLARVPEPQRQAASALLAQYGPRFFEMAQEDAWQYLRRLMAGDLDVVAELDGVLECACVGMPDAKTGEAIKLVVVKKDPALTEARVRAWCKEKLTGYKQPKVIEFRAELPKTPVGKILRRELRDK